MAAFKGDISTKKKTLLNKSCVLLYQKVRMLDGKPFQAHEHIGARFLGKQISRVMPFESRDFDTLALEHLPGSQMDNIAAERIVQSVQAVGTGPDKFQIFFHDPDTRLFKQLTNSSFFRIFFAMETPPGSDQRLSLSQFLSTRILPCQTTMIRVRALSLR